MYIFFSIILYFSHFTHCTRFKTANKIQAIHGSIHAYLFYYYFAFVGFSKWKWRKLIICRRNINEENGAKGEITLKYLVQLGLKRERKRENRFVLQTLLYAAVATILLFLLFIYGSKIYSFVYVFVSKSWHYFCSVLLNWSGNRGFIRGFLFS